MPAVNHDSLQACLKEEIGHSFPLRIKVLFHAKSSRVRKGHGKPGKSWNFLISCKISENEQAKKSNSKRRTTDKQKTT